MKKKVAILCFSPTSTTRTVCGAIASGMGTDEPLMLDMTLPEARREIVDKKGALLDAVDHVVVGAPVYAGKLPIPVIECLGALKGDGKNAAAVVVYGNRDYGVALHSMAEILSRNGFSVIAAGAFIAQHSYSDLIPVAMGRPDPSDLEKARQFGARMAGAVKPLSLEEIPLQWDRASRSKSYTALNPLYRAKKCIQCGKCARACPAGIIAPASGAYLKGIDRKACVGCMACVKSCQTGARYLKVNPLVQMVINRILGEASRKRKEPTVVV